MVFHEGGLGIRSGRAVPQSGRLLNQRHQGWLVGPAVR